MIARKNIAVVFILLPYISKAQHTVQHTNMFWAGYYNTIRLNKKWTIACDLQVRTKDWANEWSQFLVRSGLIYSFNTNFSVGAGLSFFKTAQYINNELLLKNEWRPWQEFSYLLALHKINFIQRLRTEERFLQFVKNNKLSSSYQYIFRLRYKFEFQFPIKENNIKLLAGNEVMVNPGYDSPLFFDQNRTSAGINFKLNSTTNLQCQYVKIFQWHSSISVLEDQNVFRLNLIQQFNLKKDK